MYLKYLENPLRRLADELLAVSLFSGGDLCFVAFFSAILVPINWSISVNVRATKKTKMAHSTRLKAMVGGVKQR